MLRNWIIRLLHWLTGDGKPPLPSPPTQPLTPARSPLVVALDDYHQALDALGDDPQTLLPVLLARDCVEAAWQQTQPPPAGQVQQFIALDKRLRKRTARFPLDDLPTWRQTISPPASAWWWFLDQQIAAWEKKKDLFWILLTGTLILITASLATDVLTRFWDGAPDTISVFGSLLTLTLTGSPLFKRGRELIERVIHSIPWIKPKYRAETLAALTFLAFLVVLLVRLSLMPLATLYNNWGDTARQTGDLATARRSFQRAVALDRDHAVAAYNLAQVYARTNRLDQAQTWYQHAIERDVNFVPSYHGLGHLYNQQAQYAEAEPALLTGLTIVGEVPTEKEPVIARYELLSNLGWAYFAQDNVELARRALEEADALETPQIEDFEDAETPPAQYRLALPHYYLAQIYEQSDQPQLALEQWKKCLRFLEPGWAQQDWRIKAQNHIDTLEGNTQ